MGRTAVYPYLAYQCLHDMNRRGHLKSEAYTTRQLGRSYRRGIRKGLFKIMSKMGISTIASYRGAQLFEIIGLSNDIVDFCFPGTVSRIKGAGFEDLHADQLVLADRAWDRKVEVEQGGLLKYVHGGEYHAFNPRCRCDPASRREDRRLSALRAIRAFRQRASDRDDPGPAALAKRTQARRRGEGRAGRRHTAPFRQRGHVLGRTVARGPRGPGYRDEPPGWPLELR